ncbi:MAG TPA: thymidine kinase [Chloroflexota bacterium]|nr:thymidine kinase [Chloroflexota bacterium]
MERLAGGSLEVIVGCMYSGKSEELIRRVRRAAIARQRIQVFKAAIDNRYSKVDVVSHSGSSLSARPVGSAAALWAAVETTAQVVAVDEAQFFDGALVDVAEELAKEGRRVLVAGLDLDFRGEPFGPMPQLMARADALTKLTAVCAVCGAPNATRTQRLVGGLPAEYSAPLIAVGSAELYEARCRSHHEVPGRPRPLAPWNQLLPTGNAVDEPQPYG